METKLPIGIDSFRKIRESGRYFVDKTLMIKDFIQYGDEVALITRPRRFGKSLNMSMLCEFFDITADSRAIFDGLAIMDTEYAQQINSYPVIYLSFKDCKAYTADDLYAKIGNVLSNEYTKYYLIFKGNVDESHPYYRQFFNIYEMLISDRIKGSIIEISIVVLERVLTEHYKINPILLIDEYDQPLISSFMNGYHDELKDFFAGLYGSALKGQDCLHQALLTGIQRVAKESIFSQLNNLTVYTVKDKPYSQYFGFTEEETEALLHTYGLELDEQVKQRYDGYYFGDTEVYNPWSVINFARDGVLNDYWINTSTNALIRKVITESGHLFRKDFDKLIQYGSVKVSADLESSFYELNHRDTIWGLLISAGYLTIVDENSDTPDFPVFPDGAGFVSSPAVKYRYKSRYITVRIPNGEVYFEFLRIVADMANVKSRDLHIMFECLLDKDIEGFKKIYQELVLDCTSYHDAKENAYHMLFLGMCISLRDIYKITSNIEQGHGRSDICMESLDKSRPHIIIEFKQGEDVESLKEKALAQIIDNKYYDALGGEVLCIGIAHNKKRCALVGKMIPDKPYDTR